MDIKTNMDNIQNTVSNVQTTPVDEPEGKTSTMSKEWIEQQEDEQVNALSISTAREEGVIISPNQYYNLMFKDGYLQKYIEANISDPWTDTPFKGYVYMSPKQKGIFGEMYSEKILKYSGFDVKPATTSTSGYDRFVSIENNEKKCEIKFGLATRDKKNNTKAVKDSFIMNHVSKDKEWDFLLFIGINPDPNDIRIIWFKKEDFRNNHSVCFNVQQGGAAINNDDYMCTKILNLMECVWVHEGFQSLKDIMFSNHTSTS
tara:strand:+ start:443 stop:1219 length:777 start_codon:yes stop_codon:yes gene_type:complete